MEVAKQLLQTSPTLPKTSPENLHAGVGVFANSMEFQEELASVNAQFLSIGKLKDRGGMKVKKNIRKLGQRE